MRGVAFVTWSAPRGRGYSCDWWSRLSLRVEKGSDSISEGDRIHTGVRCMNLTFTKTPLTTQVGYGSNLLDPVPD